MFVYFLPTFSYYKQTSCAVKVSENISIRIISKMKMYQSVCIPLRLQKVPFSQSPRIATSPGWRINRATAVSDPLTSRISVRLHRISVPDPPSRAAAFESVQSSRHCRVATVESLLSSRYCRVATAESLLSSRCSRAVAEREREQYCDREQRAEAEGGRTAEGEGRLVR